MNKNTFIQFYIQFESFNLSFLSALNSRGQIGWTFPQENDRKFFGPKDWPRNGHFSVKRIVLFARFQILGPSCLYHRPFSFIWPPTSQYFSIMALIAWNLSVETKNIWVKIYVCGSPSGDESQFQQLGFITFRNLRWEGYGSREVTTNHNSKQMINDRLLH